MDKISNNKLSKSFLVDLKTKSQDPASQLTAVIVNWLFQLSKINSFMVFSRNR